MDNVKETAKILQQALQDQYSADVAANDNQRRLAEQQLMYQNEASGTLYSGLPTWQRADLANTYATKLANLNEKFADNRVKLWNNVQDTIDQINAYNDAAKQLGGAAVNYQTTAPGTTTSAGAPIYLNGKWYTYSNGTLKEVQ